MGSRQSAGRELYFGGVFTSWVAGAAFGNLLLSPESRDFMMGEGPSQLSPHVPFTMAEICTNLTAFFHTEQGCFSIYHHTCTYTPSAAREPPKVLNLFTGGGRMPLSPPFPEYFSVKGGAKHNRALRLRAGAGAVSSPVPCPPTPAPSPVDKFSFRSVSRCVLKWLQGVVLLPAQELNYL